MTQLRELPNLADAFKLLKISIELENVPDNTIMGAAILKGVRDGKVKQVVQMIKDQAADNRSGMVEILGESLMNDIETY